MNMYFDHYIHKEIALSNLFELIAFATISWFVKYATCYDFRMSLFIKKENYPGRMIVEPSRHRVVRMY